MLLIYELSILDLSSPLQDFSLVATTDIEQVATDTLSETCAVTVGNSFIVNLSIQNSSEEALHGCLDLEHVNGEEWVTFKNNTGSIDALIHVQQKDGMLQQLRKQNSQLREKLFETEQTLNKNKWEFSVQIRHIVHTSHDKEAELLLTIDKLKSSLSIESALKKDLQSQYEAVALLFKQEKYSREYLEKQLCVISSSFSAIKEENRGKDEEISALKSKILRLEDEMAQLEQEKATEISMRQEAQSRYKNAIEKLDELTIKRELFHKKISLIEYPKQIIGTNTEVLSSLSEENAFFKQEICNLQSQITYLEDELEEQQVRAYEHHRELQEKLIGKSKHLEDMQEHIHEQEQLLVSAQIECAKFQGLSHQLEASTQESLMLKNQLVQLNELNANLNGKLKKLESASNYQKIMQEHMKKEEERYKKLIQMKENQQEKLREKTKSRRQDMNPQNLTADERFYEYLKDYGIQEEFVRVAEGVYTFGNKKVSVSFKNGCLVCRVGGGYMMVEEFLNLFLNGIEERIRSRNLSCSPISIHKRCLTTEDTYSENDELLACKEGIASPENIYIPSSAFTNFIPFNQPKDWILTKSSSKKLFK